MTNHVTGAYDYFFLNLYVNDTHNVIIKTWLNGTTYFPITNLTFTNVSLGSSNTASSLVFGATTYTPSLLANSPDAIITTERTRLDLIYFNQMTMYLNNVNYTFPYTIRIEAACTRDVISTFGY